MISYRPIRLRCDWPTRTARLVDRHPARYRRLLDIVQRVTDGVLVGVLPVVVLQVLFEAVVKVEHADQGVDNGQDDK